MVPQKKRNCHIQEQTLCTLVFPILYVMSNSQYKIENKKQEKKTYWEKIKQSTEIDSEMTQMMQLSDRILKIIIINILKDQM